MHTLNVYIKIILLNRVIRAGEGFAGMAVRDPRSNVVQTGQTAADGGPVEAANYIAEAVSELMLISRRHRLDILTYLLEMAQLEASDFNRRKARPGKF